MIPIRTIPFRTIPSRVTPTPHPLHPVVLFVALLALALPVRPAAAAARDLLVASRNTHSVKRFDGDTGAFLGNFVTRQSGGLDRTQEVAFGPDGALYVTGLGNTAVLRYDGTTGAFLGEFTSGYALASPTKMTFGPDGLLYVSQWAGSGKVVRFDAGTGAFVDEFTQVGIVNGGAHAWNGAGELFVSNWGSDGTNGTVRRFDSQGALLGVFPEAGHLGGPMNIWFGDAGDLFALDWTQGTVERFDGTTGAWLGTFVSGLTNAEGHAFDESGRLYLCDWTENEIVRFLADGTPDGVFASGGNLDHPNSCTFTPPPAVDAPGPRPAAGGLGLRLDPVRPNPTPGRALIRFGLDRAAEATLRVLDVRGREVATLRRGALGSGAHEAEWGDATAPSGVYFVRLEAGGRAVSRAMTVLR